MENMNIDEALKKVIKYHPAMMCDDCIHAGRVVGFPDGEGMFACEYEHDPRVPFNMDENTNCPLYKKNVDISEEDPSEEVSEEDPSEEVGE